MITEKELEKLLVKILDCEKVLYKFETQFDNIEGIEVSINIDMLSMVLTALGVPEDNTEQIEKKHNNNLKAAINDPDMFCRDWLSDEWFNCCCENRSTAKYIKWVKKELKEYLAEENLRVKARKERKVNNETV